MQTVWYSVCGKTSLVDLNNFYVRQVVSAADSTSRLTWDTTKTFPNSHHLLLTPKIILLNLYPFCAYSLLNIIKIAFSCRITIEYYNFVIWHQLIYSSFHTVWSIYYQTRKTLSVAPWNNDQTAPTLLTLQTSTHLSCAVNHILNNISSTFPNAKSVAAQCQQKSSKR